MKHPDINELEQHIQALVELNNNLRAEISTHKQTLVTLEASEARFRSVFENTNTGIASTDQYGRVTSFNETFRALMGYGAEALYQMNFADFTHPEDLELENIFFNEILAGKRERYYITKRYIANGGRIIWVNLSAAALRDAHGQVTNFVAVIQDVTEHKLAQAEKARLESQLQQVQKLESIGRLAGGVAHDFNNMLGVILGYTEVALQETGTSHPLHAKLIEIQKAAKRSADLTRQLLAFARQQTVMPEVLDMNAVVTGMLNMLHRLLGEDITIIWHPGQEIWPVMMDPSQFDQVMTNLCVNARDAIEQAGAITITTSNCIIDEAYCETYVDAHPGEYVKLTVSDSGAGMDAETLARIFEPFFTTKDVGEGSGLGLATVYGAVSQNNGFITVFSKPGEGATFEIYLPRHVGQATSTASIHPDNTTPSRDGHETILLVEDEPTVLRVTTLMLKSRGYTVLAASNPAEAIALSQQHAGHIHLLLSDVIMPEMNGGTLAQILQQRYPGLRCLFMSGYTADVIAQRGMLNNNVNFIHKPFSRDGLVTTIREILDRHPDTTAK